MSNAHPHLLSSILSISGTLLVAVALLALMRPGSMLLRIRRASAAILECAFGIALFFTIIGVPFCLFYIARSFLRAAFAPMPMPIFSRRRNS